MKLTDAIVAKRLGWKEMGQRVLGSVKKPIKHRGWWYPNGKFFSFDTPPPFTTSLDMIVGEIEARGLWMELVGNAEPKNRTYHAFVNLAGEGSSDLNGAMSGSGSTGAYALCSALLTYLKKEGKC